MADNSEETEISLNNLFEEALKIYESIELTKLPQKDIQADVNRSIKLLEEATKLINIAGVFSTNETIDEIPTGNIKYLAIPAMLGILSDKIQHANRTSLLETSEVYFKDFLSRLKEYHILDELFKIDEETHVPTSLEQMAVNRNEKIKYFREQKQIEQEKDLLKKHIVTADDETQRKYYLLFVKAFIFVTKEQLERIKMEKPFAAMRQEVDEGMRLPEKEKKEKPKPFQPIIITRDQVQKKIFGAGYPSLPTMTVDEFYEGRVREGIFPRNGSSYGRSLQQLENPEVASAEEEKDETKKENAAENDDEDSLRRAREMDEFKDTHRRGWGNRHNRS